MKLNQDIGIIYDTIYYNIIYFNKNTIISNYSKFCNNESVLLEYYYKFRNIKSTLTPKQSLMPFFSCRENLPCPMIEFFLKYSNQTNTTIEDFINKISEKAFFKKYYYYYYLNAFNDELDIEAIMEREPENIAKALIKLNNNKYDANLFVNFFFHFDELHNELIEYLKNLILDIKLFHIKNKLYIDNIMSDFDTKQNIEYIKTSYNQKNSIDDSNLECAISLLNRYIYICPKFNQADSSIFILGSNNKDISSFQLPSNSNINFSTVTYIISNDIMMSIIELIFEREMTITQLSNTLNVSRTSTDRFIKILLDNSIIKVIKKSGKEIYYGLNIPYFHMAKKIVNEKFDKFINNHTNEQLFL